MVGIAPFDRILTKGSRIEIVASDPRRTKRHLAPIPVSFGTSAHCKVTLSRGTSLSRFVVESATARVSKLCISNQKAYCQR